MVAENIVYKYKYKYKNIENMVYLFTSRNVASGSYIIIHKGENRCQNNSELPQNHHISQRIEKYG